jgi:hypothetical protein
LVPAAGIAQSGRLALTAPGEEPEESDARRAAWIVFAVIALALVGYLVTVWWLGRPSTEESVRPPEPTAAVFEEPSGSKDPLSRVIMIWTGSSI